MSNANDFAAFERIARSGSASEKSTLDYKRLEELPLKGYDAKLKTDKAIELTRDVTSFANAGSGKIIYGAITKKNSEELESLQEAGIPTDEITRQTIEQIIRDNITPRFSGFEVREYKAKEGDGRLYIIEIEPTLIGALQAKDNKYYTRTDAGKGAMNGYQVIDVMNRSKHPRLELQYQDVRQHDNNKITICFKVYNDGPKASRERTTGFYIPRRMSYDIKVVDSLGQTKHSDGDDVSTNKCVWKHSRNTLFVKTDESVELTLYFEDAHASYRVFPETLVIPCVLNYDDAPPMKWTFTLRNDDSYDFTGELKV